jgi:hypothetical protein
LETVLTDVGEPQMHDGHLPFSQLGSHNHRLLVGEPWLFQPPLPHQLDAVEQRIDYKQSATADRYAHSNTVLLPMFNAVTADNKYIKNEGNCKSAVGGNNDHSHRVLLFHWERAKHHLFKLI